VTATGRETAVTAVEVVAVAAVEPQAAALPLEEGMA